MKAVRPIRNCSTLTYHMVGMNGGGGRETAVDDWLRRLHAAEVPAAPVNNLDRAFAEPPVAKHEMIVEYDHPEVGKVRLPGNPIKMSDMSTTPSMPAPLLGEHTDAVLGRLLGLAETQLSELRKSGAIA